jgi:hypothetical protein
MPWQISIEVHLGILPCRHRRWFCCSARQVLITTISSSISSLSRCCFSQQVRTLLARRQPAAPRVGTILLPMPALAWPTGSLWPLKSVSGQMACPWRVLASW